MIAQALAIVVGIWLMAAPAVLSYGEPAANIDRTFGPIAAAVAGIAIWGVTRALRWLNLPIGAWLVIAPLVLGYPADAAVNSVVSGALLVIFASVRGKVRQRYGGGWSALYEKDKLAGL